MPSGVYPRKPRPVRPLEERFRGYVEVGPDCWIYRGTLDSDGYGQLVVTRPVRRSYGAHRLAWEFAFGPIPAGMVVCHKCDTPPCVNPAHLFIGTQGDNIRDMFAKGRGEKWVHRGAANPAAKAALRRRSEKAAG